MGTRSVRADSENSFDMYRRHLSKVEILDRETERELALRWRDGDRRAGERLVSACLPFVVSIAIEYRRWGVPMEDIVQQGNLGLWKAAAKFDPSKDCRLATYAAYWIRAEIREYVVRTFRVVRLGTTKAERRALRTYRKTKVTDVAVLSESSGVPEARLRMLLPLFAARESSLDASVQDGYKWSERIASEDLSPEELTQQSERDRDAREVVARAVGTLDAREQLIVSERLMNEEPPTLQELGTRLGVSKERVRQLEERARMKLRGALGDVADLVA